MRRTEGFTLLEVIVVMVIIAIIAGIAIPSYLNYIDRAKVRVAQSDMLSLAAVVENTRQRTLSYPTGDGVEQFSSWHPSSKSHDFAFDYASDGTTYSITGTADSGRISGCTLTLEEDNTRTVTEQCKVKEW